MATSQNGWSASPSLKTRVIEPAKGVKIRVRDDDDVAYALNYVGEQWHKRVEPLNVGVQDDWGFAYRENRNDPNSLSNHSSGTAVDYNAVQHPNGVATSRTFTAAEQKTIRSIIAEFDGALRWGGDYKNTPDAMHVEVNVSKAKLAAAVKKHKAAHSDDDTPKPPAGKKPLPVLSRGDRDKVLVPFLKRFFYGPTKAPNYDEHFGAGTQAKVRTYQLAQGLVADGVVGPKTWKKIVSGGTKLPEGYAAP